MAPTLTARVRRHVLDIDLTLEFDHAPVTVLFGPSGAGKTTLLRCLAGLDRPEAGSHIALGDQVWDSEGVHVAARHRHVGYLFQDHALFPHLGVNANVAYGLHHLARRDRPARGSDALRAAGAEHLAGRATRQLSGGEAQRVALARALAPHPRLLLLDEPLSALDAPTRARLRAELRQRLVAAAVPTLVVTHDRAEALTLGDRIAVIVGGRLRQYGAVEDVFSRPRDSQVAEAVEVETVVWGKACGQSEGLTRVRVGTTELLAVADDELLAPRSEGRSGPAPRSEGRSGPADVDVLVCIRAEEVSLQVPQAPYPASPRNHLPAAVTAIVPDGPLLRVDLDAGFPLAAYITRPTLDELDLGPGSRVVAVIKATAVHLVRRA